MKIIPAKPQRQNEANGFKSFPAPDALMRRALIIDGSFEDAAVPAIRRAEAAVKRVQEQSRDLIPREIERLSEAFVDYREKPGSEGLRTRLFRAVHDLRGAAGSFEQPFIERMAQSLSRLMAHCAAPPLVLLQAHVDALRAAAREDIRDATSPLAAELAGELERRTRLAIDRGWP